MMSMYTDVMWAVMMSLSCLGVDEIVCKRLLLLTMYVKFLGSWKECILANTAAPNDGRAKLVAWDELTRCIRCVLLLIFSKKSKIHFVGGFDEISWR